MLEVKHNIDAPETFDTTTCEVDHTGALIIYNNPEDLMVQAIFAPGVWGAVVLDGGAL